MKVDHQAISSNDLSWIVLQSPDPGQSKELWLNCEVIWSLAGWEHPKFYKQWQGGVFKTAIESFASNPFSLQETLKEILELDIQMWGGHKISYICLRRHKTSYVMYGLGDTSPLRWRMHGVAPAGITLCDRHCLSYCTLGLPDPKATTWITSKFLQTVRKSSEDGRWEKE